MNATGRRKHVRVETSNLISYESIDKDDEIVFNSMGRALNVSRSGIMLEIAHFIKAEYVSLTTVDLENNLIKVKGQLIYCRKTDSGLYQAGIRFTASEEEKAEFAVKLIRLYHFQKHNMILHVAA
jgi:hypothetical protein